MTLKYTRQLPEERRGTHTRARQDYGSDVLTTHVFRITRESEEEAQKVVLLSTSILSLFPRSLLPSHPNWTHTHTLTPPTFGCAFAAHEPPTAWLFAAYERALPAQGDLERQERRGESEER